MKSKIIHSIQLTLCACIAALLTALPAKVSAQDIPPQQPLKLELLLKPGSNAKWLQFREGTNIDPARFFARFKSDLRLQASDSMKLMTKMTDELKFNHFRYQQYYKNHRVVYGEYVIHQQPDGFVRSANGQLITGLNLPDKAGISEAQALTNALRFMGAKKYLWQNSTLEKDLKRQQKNEAATYYPKGELVFAPAGKTLEAAAYKLAWHFKIYTDDPSVIAKSVYVDAVTGKVINSADIAMQCSGGTGTSAFNGNVSISTTLSGGSYFSLNDCQATNIYVFNCGGGAASNTYYSDADNNWSLTSQQSAVQAQWGGAMTYAYYNGQHSRQSWDGASGDMILYNNAYAGSNNACWGCTGNSTIYYAGSTSASTDDWNTNDLIGHEFTHGVTQASANLVYEYESGALNESFSDIFGEMVESWSEGNCDYLVGGDRGAIRSFSNPNLYGDPDTYLGTNWYTGTGDNGGVHINSGVQNHWFYLLSEGGSGTNDFGTAYNVTGITRFKARLIAYRALNVYLTSSSQYIDARRATLQAAWDLYGQCSPEIIAVGDAWHAVGVESQSPAYALNACGSYPASGTFIQAISMLTAANGCATTITASSSTVYFTARDKVILYPGFTAVEGSSFVAYLEPCSSTRWLQGSPLASKDHVVMSDPEKGLKQQVSTVSQSAKAPAEEVIKETVIVTPNPFHTSFDITIQSERNTTAKIILYNSAGSKVQEKQNVPVIKGINRTAFGSAKLASGVYYLEIIMDGNRTMKSITRL